MNLEMVIVFIGLAVLVLFVLWQFEVFGKKAKPNITTAPGIILPDSFPFQYTRPSGGLVFSVYEIPFPLQSEVLTRIDRGLERMATAARHYNPTWDKMMTPAEITPIILIEPMATNRDGSPALLVGGIQTAGTVINVGFPDNNERGLTPYIVAPAQREWNFLDYLEATMYHEGEHLVEWKNDKAIFWMFTGPDDVHPHWPEVNSEIRSLRSASPSTDRSCGGAFPNQSDERGYLQGRTRFLRTDI